MQKLHKGLEAKEASWVPSEAVSVKRSREKRERVEAKAMVRFGRNRMIPKLESG